MWFVFAFSWLIIYSMVGWFYETLYCSIHERRFVNRGFLSGPVCPIYGVGALVILLALDRGQEIGILALFLSGAVLTSVVEYFVSWGMEKIFHARWWDYSQMRFHINGRVSLVGAIVFGVFSVVLVKWLHPAARGLLENTPFWLVVGFDITAAVLLAVDIFFAARGAVKLTVSLQELQELININREKYARRMLEVREDLSEYSEELRERLEGYRVKFSQWAEQNRVGADRYKKLLSRERFQERRILKAFPNLKSDRYQEALEGLKLRANLKKKKK